MERKVLRLRTTLARRTHVAVTTLLLVVAITIFPDRNLWLSDALAATTGAAPCQQTVASTTGVTVTAFGTDCVVTFAGSGQTSSRTHTWTPATGVDTVWLLAIGGGGSGGTDEGGGGGAGLFVEDTSLDLSSHLSGGSVAIEVGSGGVGNFSCASSYCRNDTSAGDSESAGRSGGDTTFGNITADGGGGGGTAHNSTASIRNGGNGGSGGGGSGEANYRGSGGSTTRATDTEFGSDGASGELTSVAASAIGGGGGGAGGTGTSQGVGGAGKTSSITGSSVTYAGGGGGGRGNSSTNNGGVGGSGGGGSGGDDNTIATDGTDGRGAGGGGSGGDNYSGNPFRAGDGGDGIVIVRYSTLPAAPTISSVSAQDRGVSVTFAAPDHTGGSAITDYEYSLDGTNWTSFSTSSAGTQTISGLTNGTSYTIRVRAKNTNGTGSAATSSAVAPGATVTYNANSADSGSVPTDSTKYADEATVTVASNSGNLVKAGFTFSGWNTADDGSGTSYAAGSGTFTISADTTLYAEWATNPTVTAPSAPTFSSNTSGQDPGDFVIANFSASATLQVSIGFVDPPSGTSFALPVTTGLTAGVGYDFTGNKTQISFTGTQANANAALAAMTVSTGTATGNVVIRVTASVDTANTYYNPINGHYYEVVTRSNTYAWSATASQSAFDLAEARTLDGVSGYLANVTTAQEQKFIYENISGDNIWLGATDDYELINSRCGAGTFANQTASEGKWYWVSGPVGEKCTKFWEGATSAGLWVNSSTGSTQARDSANVASSRYENWCTGNSSGVDYALTAGRSMSEPNNSGSEHYLLEKWSGARCWNDWGRKDSGVQSYYLVEYSGTFSGGSSATATVTGVVDVLSPTFTTSESTTTNSAGPFEFTVTFDVAVSGVAGDDFEDSGTNSSCSYSVVSVSSTVYTLTAATCFAGSTEGTIVPRFKANGATRADGVNSNTGPLVATTSSVTITRETTAPSVSGFTSSQSSPTNASSFSYTLTFSESVTGVAAGDFSNSGTATGCSFDPGSDSGSSRTVTVSGCSEGTVIPQFASSGASDVAGNTGPSSAATATTTVTRKTSAPSVDSFTSSQSSPTNASSFSYTLTFSESVTGVAAGDFSNSGTATGCSFDPGSDSGSSRTVTVSGCGAGTVTPVFADNGATDLAGNTGPASAATSTTTIVRDITSPTVTLAAVSATSSLASISFTVTGDEDLDCATLSATDGADFDLTNVSAISSVVQTSSTVCTVNVTSSAVAGGGAVVSTLTAASSFSVSDAAGNAQTSLTDSPQSVTVTVPAPSGGGGSPATTSTSTTTTTTTTSTTTTSTIAVVSTTTPTSTPSTSVARRSRRTTTTSSVRVVVTSTSAPVSVTSTTLRRSVPTTSVRVISGTTTTSLAVTSTTVKSRVAIETVQTPTTVNAGPATTLPLTQPVAPVDVQGAIAGRDSNVQDFSVPVFVGGQLPKPEPLNPLVIQTDVAAELDIITINNQVVQLQDTEGFRLSVSSTDDTGVLARVNTRGAIVVEHENFITVTGDGFKPGSDAVVWLFSEPRRLGVVRVDGDGLFEESLQIGSDVPVGDHTTQINGITANNEVRSLNLAVEVTNRTSEPAPASVATDTTIDPVIVAATGPRNQTSIRTAILLLGVLLGGTFVWFMLAWRRRAEER
ncbi:MAG: beta strand repeat-containing protein [Ilumatobacteraceae bacterium]